ncbi:hypothetical protein H6G36_25425 [Anabaena minutissima FACHB-250]|nr:hypothetical protein [Anabaena minutissima FACHB-250]
MNEYQYLRAIAYDRFEADFRDLTRFFRKEEARIKSEISDCILQQFELEILKMRREYLAHQLYLERIRAEDIIHWLAMDTQLRQDGLTYPDQHERNTIFRYAPINQRENCC